MRLTDKEIAAKEKELGRRLSSTEKGIYGRQATPEEQVRFQAWAREWMASEPKRRERDQQLLKEFVDRYLKDEKETKRAKFRNWVRKHCITITV